MFRTRLTHSIEVGQIGRSIARALGLNEDLSETIALAHDLGHTPFGHAGQDALNKCMQDLGGFEHNLQSLRTVDELEERYAEFSGLNLTFESREGILKHCAVTKAKQLGDVGKRFINKQQPSLEAQMVNLADEIAYSNHDVDDGLRSGLIQIEQLQDVHLFNQQLEDVKSRYPNLPQRRMIYEIIRRMINQQVVDLIETSRENIDALAPKDIEDVRNHKTSLISFSDAMLQMHQELRRFLHQQLYQHYRVHRMSAKAGRIIYALFDAFMNDPQLLNTEHQANIKKQQDKQGELGHARAVADYIAGMTDRYAIAEYGRIFNPVELT